MAKKPRRVILDTDIGTDVDDVLALAFALASPEIDLVGITVVDGDVLTRAKMAARVLGMAGRPDIPVFMGESSPIGAGRMPTWFGHEGEGLLDLPWHGEEATISDINAAEWMVEQTKLEPIDLVAVGPFTNIAKAVKLDSDFSSRVTSLTVMGGMVFPQHYDAPWNDFFQATGLPPNHMDHNTASDLQASLIMAQADFNLTWVTAELTFCTTLDRSSSLEFAAGGSILGDRIVQMIDIWSSRFFRVIPAFPDVAEPFPKDAVAALHDPLAISALLGGQWLGLEDFHLEFGIEDNLFRVTPSNALSSGSPHSESRKHRVSVSVDRTVFAEIFSERVLSFLSKLT